MTSEQLLTIIASLGGLILPVALALATLILAQSRSIRSELREAARGRSEIRARLGRIEGYPDVLREFFVGSGRGTAA